MADFDFDFDSGPGEAEGVEYRRLWAAVFLCALRDLAEAHRYFVRASLAERKTKPVEQSEPYRWLCSQDSGRGTFIWVCGVLDLDPDRTRIAAIHNCHRVVQAKSKDKKKSAGKRRRTTPGDED